MYIQNGLKSAVLSVAVLAIILVGCKRRYSGPETKQTPAPPSKAVKGKKGGKVAKAAKGKKPTAGPVDKKKAERMRRVKAELDRYTPFVIRFDASKLNAADKKLVSALLEAVTIVEELNHLQNHPSALLHKKAVASRGTADDKRLYARYQMVWCTDDEHKLCNVHPDLVPKAVGLYHWPEGMTDKEFARIKKAPNKKELLSPFTVVRRSGPKKWKAIPYSQDLLFGPRMKLLAAALRRAAAATGDPSLKKFLLSRAAAFGAKGAFPYDASDYDWIALKGKWEVNVGPYETYKNPRQLKARFKMVFGIEDKAVTSKLAPFKKNLQLMENALAALVGPAVYKARKLDPRIAVRAIQVISSGGDARAAHGATVAFHLPNRGKSVDEGLYKKVMLVNHSTAFKTIVTRRAALVLDASQQPMVNTLAGITNTTFHEFSHGFGSHDELKIRTKDGKLTTVHLALREHTTIMEELKADVTAYWLIAQSVKRGWLKPEEAQSRYVSGLMHILGLSAYPLKGTYPRMVAVELGWYMDHGGVTWENGRFKVDFVKLPLAVESLAKHVSTLQLTGDYAGVKKLIGSYVKTIVPGKKYEYVGKIKAPLNQMKVTFKKANVKSVAISYQVSGL